MVVRNPSRDGLISLLLINSTAKQLHISNFEYRLLHYFQSFCVPLFSFNKDSRVDAVWRNEVPKLWHKSPLVRQAVFLFSSINLWPLVNLECFIENPHDTRKLYEAKSYNEVEELNMLLAGQGPNFDPDSSPEDGNLYVKTTNYFMSSLRQTSEKISEHSQIVGNRTVCMGDDTFTQSAELVISGILIFAFLGIHPHRLLPLVNFDPDNEETDFLAICAGIRQTMSRAIGPLSNTPYKDLFFLDKMAKQLPTIPNCYPIIQILKNSLIDWIHHNHYDECISSDTALEVEVYTDCLDLFHSCLYSAVSMNYPIPLFRYIIMVDSGLQPLIRAKRPFAVKLLYYYSALCMMCRLLLFSHTSIWMDYMEWYKNHCESHFGGWHSQDELVLYKLVHEANVTFKVDKFYQLSVFDPRSPYIDVLNQMTNT